MFIHTILIKGLLYNCDKDKIMCSKKPNKNRVFLFYSKNISNNLPVLKKSITFVAQILIKKLLHLLTWKML